MGSPGAQGHPSLLAPACGGNRPALFPCRCRPGRAASPGWPRGSDPRCSPRPAPPAERSPCQSAGRAQPGLFTPCTRGTSVGVADPGVFHLGRVPAAQLGCQRSPGPSWPPGTGTAFLRPAPAAASSGCGSSWQDIPKPCSLPGRPHSSSLLETGYFHSPAFQPH